MHIYAYVEYYFSPPDSNGCDSESLTPEEKTNCGTHLCRTNAETCGENWIFEGDQYGRQEGRGVEK